MKKILEKVINYTDLQFLFQNKWKIELKQCIWNTFWMYAQKFKKKKEKFWFVIGAQFLLQVNLFCTKKYKHFQDQDTSTFTVYILSQKPPPLQRPLWVKQ